MATTCNDLIDATLDHLLGGLDDRVNVLAAGVNAGDTTLSFAYDLDAIVPGSFLGLGLEVVRVMETNTTNSSAVVLRGQRGSTAAAHSSGAVVQVSPRFSRWSVFRAINDDLDDLSGLGLFRMNTAELTYNPSVMTYDLTGVSSVEQVYSVRYEVPGASKEWPLLLPSEYRFERNADTSDFASGFSLTLYGGGYAGRKVRVAYKAPFTRMTSATDDVQAVAGLPATANELPPLGAALRLISGHESGRVAYETQPDTRRADEVPVGASLQTASGWRRQRADRIDSELKRLARYYPVRRG